MPAIATTMPTYTNWDDVPLFIGTQEAADLLAVHVNTIKNMILDGKLPAQKVGRVYRINKNELVRAVGFSPESLEDTTNRD